MKTLSSFIIGFLPFVLLAGFAFAQSTVNQGAPGTQGAWPVRFVTPTFPSDGGAPSGFTASAVYPYPCATTSPNKVTFQDGGSQNIPATGATNRLYTVVCNSRDNSSGNVRCRADGTAPANTVGTAGDVLGVGDCVAYTNSSGAPIQCIGASLYVTSFECVR